MAGAYIFSGPPGSGKKEAAGAFAEILECSKQDRFWVEPEGGSIKIEQIRELQKAVRYGPSAGSYLLVVLDQADKLTDQAAAAFLKTLEEPPPGVIFVLLVEREDEIPSTVRSRSQRIVFAERKKKWERNHDFDSFYESFENLHQKKTADLLRFSASLGNPAIVGKGKEGIEELLYDLSFFARYEMSDIQSARIVLDALRHIKRKANLKLALDTMCLKLGAENGKKSGY